MPLPFITQKYHIWSLKKKKSALYRVVWVPDTYYRELFYPFSPISQMFYCLETGELLELVIEAHLLWGGGLVCELREAFGRQGIHLRPLGEP